MVRRNSLLIVAVTLSVGAVWAFSLPVSGAGQDKEKAAEKKEEGKKKGH